MKLGFVTCVQLGLSCMEAIYDAGGELSLVVSLKDDIAPLRSGRVFVDEFAEKHGIPVCKVKHVDDWEAVKQFQGLDWLFIIGWSQIAGMQVLDAPRHGVLGMHPTLLPEGRGRAAIPWAILKGLERTGVTLFKLDGGIDTGPVIAQLEIPLARDTTATDLYSAVESAHVELIGKSLPKLLRGELRFTSQQDEAATVWPGRRPEDGEIDLGGSVKDAERLVRATTHPYPGAFYLKGQRKKTIVWSARIVDRMPQQPFLEFRDGYLQILESEVTTE